MTLPGCANRSRWVSTLLAGAVVVWALTSPASAAAQDPAPNGAWVPEGTVVAAETTLPDDAPVSTHHEVRRWALVIGGVALGLGYVGALIWGSYYLASLHLGVPGCNDLYGGFQFLPIAGPIAGMLTGGACVPDQLHVEEAILPVVFTAVQLTGVVLLAIGAAGRQVRDVPSVALRMDGSGGTLIVGGTF